MKSTPESVIFKGVACREFSKLILQVYFLRRQGLVTLRKFHRDVIRNVLNRTQREWSLREFLLFVETEKEGGGNRKRDATVLPIRIVGLVIRKLDPERATGFFGRRNRDITNSSP